LEQTRRFHYLYERASADLAKITTFAAEPELRRYLENLVARAYSEIHETREKQHRFAPWKWFAQTLPQTFRRHIRAFWLSLAITVAGCLFGRLAKGMVMAFASGLAVALDPEAKAITIPFANLHGDPSERVAQEEKQTGDHLRGVKARGTAFYITNNTSVALKTLALGMTWGIGTIVLLFSTGVMVGAVAVDYVAAGQTKFLVGWLLPHGSFEIPAIIIAGQAGLMLGGALIGWGQRLTLAERLRAVSPDLITLTGGVALMLAWAGVVEAFFSQYHEPVLPYSVKISFGTVELVLLTVFLAWAGRKPARNSKLETRN
jgi:uncharacterized membrane protein SpoIIM required for sporulation